jgi:oligoendopeptidase F
LVLSLYQRYRQLGKAFVPMYLDILSAGGSQAPVELLAKHGLDVAQPTFWQGGFEVIEGWIEECERIQVLK